MNRNGTPVVGVDQPLISPEAARVVSEMDARWRARTENQKDAINRLLMDSSYSHEMDLLHSKLAHLQARISTAVELLRTEPVTPVAAKAIDALLR